MSDAFRADLQMEMPRRRGKSGGADTKHHPVNMRASSHAADNGLLKNEVNHW
jgi:hypothetical protein